VCVALAVGAPVMLTALSRAARTVTGVTLGPLLLPGKLTVIPAHADFSAFSPTYLAGDDLGVFLHPRRVEGRDQLRLAFDRLRAQDLGRAAGLADHAPEPPEGPSAAGDSGRTAIAFTGYTAPTAVSRRRTADFSPEFAGNR
jgi:hypothetical protein